MTCSEFTIGELAEATGVPISTIRYYEREGLLRPCGRSPSNYRLYANGELERLRFIRAAQSTGFTLEDVSALLRPSTCSKVQALIEARLEVVAERMKELRHVQRVLRASYTECREHEETGRCKVVERLTAKARAKRRK